MLRSLFEVDCWLLLLVLTMLLLLMLMLMLRFRLLLLVALVVDGVVDEFDVGIVDMCVLMLLVVLIVVLS